jgi:selenocysteine-specific elongation factor
VAESPPPSARSAAPADTASRRTLLVGTAGHVDHGKTRLIEALTGTNCDRLAEEKARGITIDLGFAEFTVDGVRVGFVDVPGHQRFLHNALAGLGGIRVVLLVVAADEGIKPQTREHLAIAALLGIETALVALTKSDLADPDLLEFRELELAELLAPTPFAGASILPISAISGRGIDELRRHLLALAAAATPLRITGPARLPIDRVFQPQGQGLVVTGTLVAGTIAVGDTLQVDASGTRVRVRGVQVHGQSRAADEAARAGERTALQLAGADSATLARGSSLLSPGSFLGSRSLLARVTLLADAPSALSPGSPVRLHLFTSSVLATARPLATDQAPRRVASELATPGNPAPLEPGSTGVVELRLDNAVIAARGDRFVLRRPSPAATLCGGEILDPSWRRPRRRELAGALVAVAGDDRGALLAWIAAAGEAGATAEDLARRLGAAPDAVAGTLAQLAAEARLLVVPAIREGGPRRWLQPAVFRDIAERAKLVLARHFAADRLARGMSRAELLARAAPAAGELGDTYLGWLAKAGILELAGDLVNQPGRTPDLRPEESRLAADVRRAFEQAGLKAPSPGEVRQALNANPKIVEGVLRYLVERHEITRLPGGLLLATTAFEALRHDLLASGWIRFTVPQFKERFGLARKWAIPLLEHLDAVGATRRIGDERLIVRPPGATGTPNG